MPPSWYSIHNIETIDSPTLVIYPQRIERNVQRMIEIVGDVNRLRPHVKTHKMAEIVAIQMRHGIRKFKCATIAEAEMLGEAGAEEVLLAYQIVGPKIKRLLQLVQHFPKTKFACLVDDEAAAQHIHEVFAQGNTSLEVWLDLDVGQHRTGISPKKGALELFLFCKSLGNTAKNSSGILPVGLHVYDGHLRMSDFLERKKASDQCFEMVKQLIAEITNLGYSKPQVVAGGSPTFTVHAQRTEVDCSPGTCLLWDYGYAHLLPEQNFEYAALVISRIISKPSHHLICVDLGHKSIAAENPFPRVHFLNLPKVKAVGQSEEHLVLDVGDNSNFKIGMPLYGVPIHICPTCALYEKAYVVEEDGLVKKSWKIVARNRMLRI